MSPESLLELIHYTLLTAAKLAAPYMLSSVIIGVLINIVQTVTSIKDQALTFIPKVVGVGVIGLMTLPWNIQVSLNYFNYIMELISAG